MPESDPFPGFINIKDAPACTGKSLFTLRRYLREGKLAKYKFGRSVYLRKSDLVPQPMPQPKRRANGK